MKNKAFLLSGAIATALAAYFCWKRLAGIDPMTGLTGDKSNITLLFIMLALVLLSWGALAMIRLPHSSKVKTSSEKTREKEKAPVYADSLIDRAVPAYAAAFYIAAFLLWLMAAIFFILYAMRQPGVISMILALASLLTSVSFVRYVLIHIRRRTTSSDAVLLPMPLIFTIVFCINDYLSAMIQPQMVSYYHEILADIAILLSFYGFISHFFGRNPRRGNLFFALTAASFAAVCYFSQAAIFFFDKAALETVDGSLYIFIAKLLFFAAASVFSVAYAIILWYAPKKNKKGA